MGEIGSSGCSGMNGTLYKASQSCVCNVQQVDWSLCRISDIWVSADNKHMHDTIYIEQIMDALVAYIFDNRQNSQRGVVKDV